MAKKKSFTPAGVSRPTGKMIACPINPFVHGHEPVAVIVMRGPKRHFVECGGCKTRAFLPSFWTDEMGWSPKEARQYGLRLPMAPPRIPPSSPKT